MKGEKWETEMKPESRSSLGFRMNEVTGATCDSTCLEDRRDPLPLSDAERGEAQLRAGVLHAVQ